MFAVRVSLVAALVVFAVGCGPEDETNAELSEADVTGEADRMGEVESALSSRCHVSGYTCTTGAVRANTTGHYVYIFVRGMPQANYQVTDSANGVVVASGSVTAFWSVTRKISGLYSSYRLKVSGAAGAWGNIADYPL